MPSREVSGSKTEKEENRLFFFVPPQKIDGLTEVRSKKNNDTSAVCLSG